MRGFRSLTLMLAASPFIWAQQTPPPAGGASLEEELLALMNTPIQGASKREQRLIDSPQAVEVLTGDEIRQMGIFRLQDALKLMTSIDLLEADNGYSVVGIRGIMQEGQPRTVQILVDGVPMYSPIGAGIDVSNLPVPIEMIDKVEVVRGPSSTLYGANAVAGVIAISTRAPGKGVSGQVRAAVADNQTARGDAHVSLGNERYGITAGYQGYSMGASGFETHYLGRPTSLRYYYDAPTSTSVSANPWIGSDAAHGSQMFARAQGTFGKGTVWLNVGQSSKWYGPEGYFSFRSATRTMLLGGWRQEWAPTFTTEVRIHQLNQINRLSSSDYLAVALEDPGFYSDYDWSDQTTTQAEVQANWTALPNLHIVLGADTRQIETGTAPFVGLAAPAEESASGAFLAVDWKLHPSWTLSVGARVENESLGGSRTSPRAALVWNPTPSSALRAGYYTSTRSPQILEQRVDLTLFTGQFYPTPTNPAPPNIPVYFEIQPNSALKPEKTENLELGYRQAFGAFTVDLTVYQMKLTELINQNSLAPYVQTGSFTPPFVPITYTSRFMVPTQFQNAGDATNSGLELALTWAFRKGWVAGANMTLLDFTKDSYLPSDPMGEDFAYTVNKKGNLWVRGTEGKWTFFGAIQAVGSTTAEALSARGVPSFEPRESFVQWHANVAYAFWKGLSVGLFARNGAKDFTLQGATGPERQTPYQAMRRELGAQLAYRF